ncbi:MAG: type I CRISPR-associated protein Cas7 [Actinobacteria bacterium]|nr:type I CRISPR-associated protein Cas7 [Actinomycetota bacterium]
MGETINSAEILFIKCVKDGIPNRDPLRDSDARRIFGDDDRRISLSDVSIKRDVRDYVMARYPDGGDDKSMFVFCREERTPDNKLLGRDKLAKALLERAGRGGSKDLAGDLKASAFDVRVFGAVFSVEKKSFHQCGPVQFGWAHSLHPVETKYVQGTVVMPSKDTEVTEEGKEEGLSQGTIWTTYTLPFAVFAMPGVINSHIAQDTGMTDSDVNKVLEGLWKGTINRQARGRGIQQPLLLLHVEYADPFFRIGFLENLVRIEPSREAWQNSNPPTSVEEIALSVERLGMSLKDNRDKIKRARLWRYQPLKLEGEIPAEERTW